MRCSACLLVLALVSRIGLGLGIGHCVLILAWALASRVSSSEARLLLCSVLLASHYNFKGFEGSETLFTVSEEIRLLFQEEGGAGRPHVQAVQVTGVLVGPFGGLIKLWRVNQTLKRSVFEFSAMETRKRSARQMEPESRNAVDLPVWEHVGLVPSRSATTLLDHMENLPESVWKASAGRDHFLKNEGCQWLDFGVRGDSAVTVPKCMAPVKTELLAAVTQLLALTECVRIGRVFINRYLPTKKRGGIKQFALAPHVDSGRMTSSLSLRPAGSNGGLLAVSADPGGVFPRKGSTDCVDTRYGKVAYFNQRHGSVLTVKGAAVEHGVTTTTKAARYALVVFGV